MQKAEEEDGGHIRIQKIDVSKTNYITHIIKNIGDTLTNQEVDILISDLLSYNLITEKEARLLKVATSDNILIIAKEVKDTLRARILKNMLLKII